MGHDRLGAVCIAVAAAIGSGCTSAPPGGDCGSVTCAGGELCLDSVCRRLCNSDGECITGERCVTDGICQPVFCVIGGSEVSEGSVDPNDPCMICLPLANAAEYVAADDGTPCTDDEYCTIDETCTGGTCTSTTTPCPTDKPFCLEMAEACSCNATSCDDGIFCNGDEMCNTGTGDCIPGTAPSCSGATASCNEEVQSCAACGSDADCSAPNPNCVGGICTSCPTCTCPTGEHDGGDGICVAIGQCSGGYIRPYTDFDNDGFGAGLLLDDCVEVLSGGNLPAGYASTGGDCNDTNPNEYQLLDGYADADGDGYTAAAQAVCTNGTLPAAYAATGMPVGLPVTDPADTYDSSFGTSGRGWSNRNGVVDLGGNAARVKPNQTSGSRYLVAADFGADIPDTEVITGIRFHVVRFVSQPEPLNDVVDLSVRLVQGGNLVGGDRANTGVPWPIVPEEVVYGGPTDLWDLSGLTPAEVNDWDFGIAIKVGVTGSNDGPEANVDYIWMEIYTATSSYDCDDADPNNWLELTGYPDGDGDLYSSGPSSLFCVTSTLPAGYSGTSLGTDCDDADAAVHPNQATFFSTPRSDGTYDYNCDGSDEPAPVTTHLTCTGGCLACNAATTQTVVAASCGGSNTIALCTGNCVSATCNTSSASQPTRCR